MKHFLLLFLFALALFPACTNNKSATIDELDSGTAKVGLYRNESLGWTMTLPADWSIRPAPTDAAGPGAGAEAMRRKRKKQLLFLCYEPRNCNNSLAIVAQDTVAARGANTPERFYKQLIEVDEENNQAYQVKGMYKKGTATFGGKEFYWLEITRQEKTGLIQKLKQVHYFRFFGPHLVTIRMSYDNEPHEQILLNILKSSKFEDPA